MSQIIIRGAQLRFYDGRVDKAGAYKRLHLRLPISETLCEELGVSTPPEEIKSGKFNISLVTQQIAFEPNGQSKKERWILKADTIDDFAFNTKQNDEDSEETETYLSCVAQTRQEDAAAICEQFHNKWGLVDGVLTIMLEQSGQQQSLEQEESTDAPEEQEPEAAGALAPAVVVAGNADALKKARKGRQKPKAQNGDGASCQVSGGKVEGDDDAIRKHEWTHERGRATVRIYDDAGQLSAITNVEIDGLDLPAEWQINGDQTINHLGVAAMGELERWSRETAKTKGISSETKSALARLLSWARDIAGTYRVAGRIEYEQTAEAAAIQ